MFDLYKASQHLPNNPAEWCAADLSLASTIVDEWQDERDTAPLTLELMRELGWNIAFGTACKPGSAMTVSVLGGVAHLDVANARLVRNATLGDLRTLERILSKEPTR